MFSLERIQCFCQKKNCPRENPDQPKHNCVLEIKFTKTNIEGKKKGTKLPPLQLYHVKNKMTLTIIYIITSNHLQTPAVSI